MLLPYNIPIIEYQTLYDEITDIEQLLDNPYKACIILYVERIINRNNKNINVGHWTCILGSNDKTLIFFDSYGNIVDSEQNLYYNKTLFQKLYYRSGKKRIVELFLKSKKYKKYEYNHKSLQKNNDNINTCGRHCVTFIKSMFENKKWTLDDYLEFIRKKIKDPDKYVTFYTNQLF